MSLFAAAAGIREPLLRWPCFAAVWLFTAPGYFIGAWQHDRLTDRKFWEFTWDVFCAAMSGGFVGIGRGDAA